MVVQWSIFLVDGRRRLGGGWIGSSILLAITVINLVLFLSGGFAALTIYSPEAVGRLRGLANFSGSGNWSVVDQLWVR